MTTLTLRNANLELDLDRRTGALTGLRRADGSWEIIKRPELGLSFRMLVPLAEDQRDNQVLGEKQTLASLTPDEDGQGVNLVWEKLVSERGGTLDIRFSLRIRLEEERALFAARVENHSPFTVENVYCPYLGEARHPEDAEWFKTFIYTYNTANEWRLWPHYDNHFGYFGVDYPTQFHTPAYSGTPMSPFFFVRSQDQGLYLGVDTPSAELVAWHTELRPGYGSSIDQRVPTVENISGKDVAIRVAAVHVPFILSGQSRDLTPIALQFFSGGWQKGADIYRKWRDRHFHAPKALPQWAQEPHAWQQLHINSPEDELRIPFRDLPKVAEECARNGVKAIQLVGWNDGGQDQGNPSHTPDPRLGTFEEFQQAIRETQALGVKMILFSKFTWADRGTDWYRRELIRLAIKDPYGDPYLHPGYKYQTATQLLDINTKRLIPMCFLSEEYLAICQREFNKMLDLGADGTLFDECLHHGPALLCFDPHHGHRYGAPVYANDRQLIWNWRKDSEPRNPDFLFAGEATYDWEMEAYQLSYHRTESKTHIPLSRYLRPEAQFMTAVTGFNDRNMINQCLLYRYIISYEPYNFKGRLDDYPLTMAYGRKMDALRTELRAWFWDGEYRDAQEALVTVDGKPHHPFAVFLKQGTREPGVAVANYEEEKEVRVKVERADGGALSRWRLVDGDWQDFSGEITLPPQSAAVII